jgi:hypothetical protein
MISLIASFFSELFYYISLIVLFLGTILYLLSFLAKLLPFLGQYVLPMQVFSVIFIFGGAYYVGDHHGYQRRVLEDQAEIARLNEEARDKELKAQEQINKLQFNLKKAKDENIAKQTSINARIDSGELRIPSSCSVQTSPDTSNGSTNEGSEPERTFLKATSSLFIEADNAIEERNACIFQYNEVRRTFNEMGK